MKFKSLLTLGIVAMFILSIGVVFPIKAYPGTNIYVDPPLVQKFTNTTHVGDSFSVTLNYGNMTDLGGIQYTLYWNNTVLSVTNVHDTLPWSGLPFIATNTTTNSYNATFGQMNFVAASLSGGVTGSKAFRTVIFKILVAPAAGQGKSVSSVLAFGPYNLETLFGDASGNAISLTDGHPWNGEFILANPSVSGPIATSDNYDLLWHTTDFTITLTATGGTNGIAHTYYKINGGSTQDVTTNGQPLITTEGKNNTLEYWSVDGAGNIENHHFLQGIKLDKTAPTGSIIINNGATQTNSTSVKLSLTATDKISGVDKIKLSNTDLSTATWMNFSATQPWQLTSGNGNKTVYYQVRSVANLTSTAYSASIILNITVIPFTQSVGEALHFNGVNQYVSVPVTRPLNNSYVYTFELWFNSSSNYGPLIGSNRFRIDVTDNGLTVWYDVSKSPLQWSTTVKNGQWHDLIVVIDYRIWNVTPYLDGKALGPKSAKMPTIPVMTWMNIGYDNKTAGGFFNGTIDEVRIYNKTMNDCAVQWHYNNATGYYGRPEKGLIAGWHFDESSGSIATDYSGNGKNATIHGATWVDGHILLPNSEFGDMNGDGKVNLLDLIIVAKALGNYLTHKIYDPFADTSSNDPTKKKGYIDILDLLNVAKNIGKHL